MHRCQVILRHAELAAAVSLVVEAIFLDDLITAVLKTILTPVLIPPDDQVIWWNSFNPQSTKVDSPLTGFIDLVQGFPSRRSQSGGDDLDASPASITGCAEKTQLEAFQASASPLGLVLQTLHLRKPTFMVIIRVDDLKSERLSIAGALVLTDLVLLIRIYVRVAIIYDRSYAVLKQSLYNGT
jgi:hypothetical protein